MTEILQKDSIVYTLYIRHFMLYLFIFTNKIYPRLGGDNLSIQQKRPICARPFNQKLGSSFIYFFYLHTAIRLKIYGPLSFDLFFVHDHSTKN